MGGLVAMFLLTAMSFHHILLLLTFLTNEKSISLVNKFNSLLLHLKQLLLFNHRILLFLPHCLFVHKEVEAQVSVMSAEPTYDACTQCVCVQKIVEPEV